MAESSSTNFTAGRPTGFAPVVIGGLIAGALDLVFALVFYGLQGATPVRILQSISSGILGREAYNMGASSAVLGAVLHFSISICAACIYYLVSRRFPILARRVVDLRCGIRSTDVPRNALHRDTAVSDPTATSPSAGRHWRAVLAYIPVRYGHRVCGISRRTTSPHQVIGYHEVLVGLVLLSARLRPYVGNDHVLITFTNSLSDRSGYHRVMPLIPCDYEFTARQLLAALSVNRKATNLLPVDEAVEVLRLDSRQAILFDELLDLRQPGFAFRLVFMAAVQLLVPRRLGGLDVLDRRAGPCDRFGLIPVLSLLFLLVDLPRLLLAHQAGFQ
jgi:hypothetical protein